MVPDWIVWKAAGELLFIHWENKAKHLCPTGAGFSSYKKNEGKIH